MTTASSPTKPAAERFFYTAASVVLLALTVIGFHHFYMEGGAYPGRPLTPPTRTLVIAHALAMSAWILLAVLQPALIAAGNRRLHMTLGRIAAVLAVALVLLGLRTGIESARVAPPGMMYGPLTPRQFMAVPVLVIVMFAAFVAAGIAWRRKPALHRPVMFLASFVAVVAATSRIDALTQLTAGTILATLFASFAPSVVIGAILVVVKCALTRSLDRPLVLGYVAATAGFALITQATHSAAWVRVADFLLR